MGLDRRDAGPPALGWILTTTAGIAVDEQYTLFGASGAAAITAVVGILLHTILPPRTQRSSATPATSVHQGPAPAEPATATIGDQS